VKSDLASGYLLAYIGGHQANTATSVKAMHALLIVCVLALLQCARGETAYVSLQIEQGDSVMPRLGLGTAGLSSRVRVIVKQALEFGTRLIDTAQASEWYSEKDVGQGVRDYLLMHPEASEEIVMVTKVHPRSFRPDKLHDKVRESHQLLFGDWVQRTRGLDYILLHSPFCWSGHCTEEEEEHSWQEAWRALEALKEEEGVVQNIGVSNFDLRQIQELISMSNTKVAAIQNWCDPLHQDKQVREFARRHGIIYMAYSSFGTQWGDKAKDTNPVLTNEVLVQIAKKHSTTTSQVVLSWLLQEGLVAIPRASSTQHVRENAMFGSGSGNEDELRVFLTNEDLAQISALDGSLGTPWD